MKPKVVHITIASTNYEELDAIISLIYDSENTTCIVFNADKSSDEHLTIDHPMMKRGRWHHKEIAQLTNLYEEDVPIQVICDKLNRTFNAVQSKLSELGLRTRKVRNQFGVE